MFALIRTYEGLSVENRDEATRKANESLRTILKQSPGFVSYELLKHDGSDGKVVRRYKIQARLHGTDIH